MMTNYLIKGIFVGLFIFTVALASLCYNMPKQVSIEIPQETITVTNVPAVTNVPEETKQFPIIPLLQVQPTETKPTNQERIEESKETIRQHEYRCPRRLRVLRRWR